MGRNWTRTELGGAVQWSSGDHGGAMVQVTSPAPHVWVVTLFENGSRLGEEPAAYYRSSAIQTAKRWVKAMTRPARV
jgi:hypothetical protein